MSRWIMGYKDKLDEFISQKRLGAIITIDEICEHLGSRSGYIGVLIKQLVQSGRLTRINRKTYKVSKWAEVRRDAFTTIDVPP